MAVSSQSMDDHCEQAVLNFTYNDLMCDWLKQRPSNVVLGKLGCEGLSEQRNYFT